MIDVPAPRVDIHNDAAGRVVSMAAHSAGAVSGLKHRRHVADQRDDDTSMIVHRRCSRPERRFCGAGRGFLLEW